MLDYENPENGSKIRFCMVKLRDKAYVFSTKPNVYKKLTQLEVEELEKYVVLTKSERPSKLLEKLTMKGNGLPLVFHPLGAKMLNERAAMIDQSLSDEEKEKAVNELVDSIIATDGKITSLTIPYPDGKTKYIYFNENNEFVVRTKTRETIYHYDEETDNFDKEIVYDHNR